MTGRRWFFVWILFVCAGPGLAGAAEYSPFGVFEIVTSVRNSRAALYISETHSVFGPAVYIADIPKQMNEHVNHLVLWRADWNPLTRTFYAEGFSRRDVNAVRIDYDESMNAVRGYFVTTDERFSPPGPLIDRITFEGHRLPVERQMMDLAAKHSELLLNQHLEAEGIFESSAKSEKKESLVLRSYERGDTRVWIARYLLGDYYIPFTGRADESGLLRLVRTPTSSPSELNGLTGTIVKGATGQLEFRGFFFVPRNGRVSPLNLRKVRDVR